MNIDTGEIMMVRDDDNLEELLNQGFYPLPPEMEHAAKCKLKGRRKAKVSLKSGGKLAKWASKKRREKRRMSKDQSQMVKNCNSYYENLRKGK